MTRPLKFTLIFATYCIFFNSLTTLSIAQNAKDVITRYNNITGINSLNTITDSLYYKMELTIITQGIESTTTLIVNSNKVNMNMFFAGKHISLVYNGKQAWASMSGSNVVRIPSNEFEKQFKQSNIFANIKYDERNAELVDSTTNEYIIEISKNRVTQLLYFDKSSGLVSRSIFFSNRGNVDSDFSSYKKFGSLLIPSKIISSSDGSVISEVLINSLEMDYVVDAALFEKPTKEL